MFDINVLADYYAELETAWAEEPTEEWPDDLWDDDEKNPAENEKKS